MLLLLKETLFPRYGLQLDWQALITGQNNPKQVLMGMTIHPITAR